MDSQLPFQLAMREMGSRYLFIVLYVWLEARLSRGDYRRDNPKPAGALPSCRASPSVPCRADPGSS